MLSFAPIGIDADGLTDMYFDTRVRPFDDNPRGTMIAAGLPSVSAALADPLEGDLDMAVEHLFGDEEDDDVEDDEDFEEDLDEDDEAEEEDDDDDEDEEDDGLDEDFGEDPDDDLGDADEDDEAEIDEGFVE